MRAWIALLLVSACTADASETFTLAFTENRADTEVKIDGTMVDGGGAAPRSLSISYDFAQSAATSTQFLVETFAGGVKLAELTVTPMQCTTETDGLTVNADGSITLESETCTP